MSKPRIEVTGFWMRNDHETGEIQVLIEHEGAWYIVFGGGGPGPVARDRDQLIDHMIHGGGIQNLIEHGDIHARPVARDINRVWAAVPVARARKTGRADRRTNTDRRASKRRLDDKSKALVAGRRRKR